MVDVYKRQGSLNIFDSPNQSINYVECHDNYTFYDEISIKTDYDEFKKWHYQDFATHLVIIDVYKRQVLNSATTDSDVLGGKKKVLVIGKTKSG